MKARGRIQFSPVSTSTIYGGSLFGEPPFHFVCPEHLFDIVANLIHNRYARESFRGNAEERQGGS